MSSERPLRFIFHESARYDIVGQRNGQLHRVAKILFTRDGSIYVSCPFFGDTNGYVGIAKIPIGTQPASVNLNESGLVTRHLVKYAHHPDGEAHFSQDGRVKTLVRRRSTPLTELRGHLCSIIARPLSEFPAPKGKDPQLAFLNHPSEHIELTIMRFRKSDLQTDNREGGHVDALTLADGISRKGVFASPPSHFTLSDFFLFIYSKAPDDLKEGSLLMLVGGFDPPAISLDRTRESEYLVYMYPNPNIDELEKSLTSIDLRPPSLR